MRGSAPYGPGSSSSGSTAAGPPGFEAAGAADAGGTGRRSAGAPVNESLPSAPSNSAVTAPSAIEIPAKVHQTDRGSRSARPSVTVANPREPPQPQPATSRGGAARAYWMLRAPNIATP